jgi:glycosyltransferase involved in cell wall biosynthesis
MIRYLEEQAPCIYIPNADWRHSCISPRLSDQVAVVGVVHSDDPLHYDHLARLHESWNAIVTVSRQLAEKVVALHPAIAARVVTIPIGVPCPAEYPVRPAHREARLRLIYHGLLIRRQKRVFDLLRIVEATTRRGVPVHLTIAGGGSEREELIREAQPLIDQGLLHFAGVLPHERILGMLTDQDVFLLTSEFEGMPNALLEAMAHGCVPIVSGISSGIPDVIRDGANGYVVPVGDVAAYADRLARLHGKPEERHAMSLNAYRSVREGAFHSESMARGYLNTFERVLRDARCGMYKRRRGLIVPPPVRVATVSIFPVDCSYFVEGVGPFPSPLDHLEFEREAGRFEGGTLADAPRLPEASVTPRRSSDLRVIIGLPYCALSGVNVFSVNLLRGLIERGVRGEILLTEQETKLVTVPSPTMALPSDLPVEQLPVSREAGWGAHWGAMIRYLESRAPAIYIPNYDWRHSCVSPQLSDRVAIVGVVHSDDPLHYDHVARLGDYWNAIVAVSQTVAGKTAALNPTLAGRISVIPYGVSIPVSQPVRAREPGAALRIGYHGVLGLRQKRIFDLLSVVEALVHRGVPVELTIAGDGPERHTLLDRARPLVERGQIRFVGVLANDEIQRVLERVDVFVLTSEFEGLPHALLEAMGRGCVPVVTDISSGVPELVRDGVNGYIVPVGDIAAFCDRLAELQRHPERLRDLAARAYQTVYNGTYRTADMVDDYISLFHAVFEEVRTERYRRSRGPIKPPPSSVAGVSIFPVECNEVGPLGAFPHGGTREFLRELRTLRGFRWSRARGIASRLLRWR